MENKEFKYLSIYDNETGERITSYVTGIHGENITHLQALALKNYPEHDCLILTESEYSKSIEKNLIYKNGTLILPPEQTEEEKALAELEHKKLQKLAEIKKLLADTDYKAVKFAEGMLTAEQYKPIKQSRALWRTAYNSIEKSETLEELKSITYSINIPEK
jgi:hypothetical protein